MILIQIVLVLAFLLLLGKFLTSPNSYQIRAWKKIIGIIFVFISIAAVLLPNLLTRIAHFLGVGRGADLLLYLLTLAFIFVVFSQYVHSQQEQKRLIKLARQVALLEANLRNSQTK